MGLDVESFLRCFRRFKEQSLSVTGTGAEEIWMGYEIFLRIFGGY